MPRNVVLPITPPEYRFHVAQRHKVGTLGARYVLRSVEVILQVSM